MEELLDIVNVYGEFVSTDGKNTSVRISNLPEFLRIIDHTFGIAYVSIGKAITVNMYNMHSQIIILNAEGCIFSDSFTYIKRIYIHSSVNRVVFTGGRVKYLRFMRIYPVEYTKSVYSQFDNVAYIDATDHPELAALHNFPNIWVYCLYTKNAYRLEFIKKHIEGELTVYSSTLKRSSIPIKKQFYIRGNIIYDVDCSIEELETINVEKLHIEPVPQAQVRATIDHIYNNPHIKFLKIDYSLYNYDHIKDNYTLLDIKILRCRANCAPEINAILSRNRALVETAKSARNI